MAMELLCRMGDYKIESGNMWRKAVKLIQTMGGMAVKGQVIQTMKEHTVYQLEKELNHIG